MAMSMKTADAYLGSTAMRATQQTMQLASLVLGFDVVELWTDEGDGHLHCTYVHATESIVQKYPDVIVGHYPNHKKEHKLSPMLCNLAKQSPDRYHWRVVEKSSESNTNRPPRKTNSTGQLVVGFELSALHPELMYPAQTEVSYLLKAETGTVSVFIVGFAMDRIDYSPQKLKFLSGLGYAIYVAAFDLDTEDIDDDADSQALDTKQFLPRPLSTTCMVSPDGELGMGVWGSQHCISDLKLSTISISQEAQPPAPPAATLAASSSSLEDITKGAVTDSPIPGAKVKFSDQALARSGSQLSVVGQTSVLVEQAIRDKPAPNLVVSKLLQGPEATKVNTPVPMALSLPPTWDPVDEFSYPVAEIPISCLVPDNLQLEHFDDMQHIADGSNANIFLAKLHGERVIIKMIKTDVQTDPVAVHEFDVEHGMLSRISHPNIIRLMGAGRHPRRFVVLEWLGGGSLNTILAQNQSKPGFAQKLFRRPTFTYANLLSKARDMAEALDFLHRRCHDGATIIHRDLKPDNVGFTNSGILKLFDFGLCTCVRRRRHLNEAYELTGNTGSLRYMAPEVALKRPYTEKADVYSFGIMVWQMARDRVPFKGLSRDDFMQQVVINGERPKLDKSWPAGFSNLMTACWDPNPVARPSFEQLVATLDKLAAEHNGGSVWPRRGKAFLSSASTSTSSQSPQQKPAPKKDTHSTWF